MFTFIQILYKDNIYITKEDNVKDIMLCEILSGVPNM